MYSTSKKLILSILILAPVFFGCGSKPIVVPETDPEMEAWLARTPRPLMALDGTVWAKANAEDLVNVDARGLVIEEESPTSINDADCSIYRPGFIYSFEHGELVRYGVVRIPRMDYPVRQFWFKTSLNPVDGQPFSCEIDESTMALRTNFFDDPFSASLPSTLYRVYVFNPNEIELLRDIDGWGYPFLRKRLKPATLEMRNAMAGALAKGDPGYQERYDAMLAAVREYFEAAGAYEFFVQAQVDECRTKFAQAF